MCVIWEHSVQGDSDIAQGRWPGLHEEIETSVEGDRESRGEDFDDKDNYKDKEDRDISEGIENECKDDDSPKEDDDSYKSKDKY